MSATSPLLPGARPLFLIGCPRSGTTFAANLLNSHPEVLMTSETAVFMLLHDVIEKSDHGVGAGINFGKQYHKLLSGMLATNYRRLVQAYYERIATEQQRSYLSYWGEKHPHMYECLNRVESEFPDACYIYVVRDPRDSACSIADMSSTEYSDSLRNWKIFSDAYEEFVSTISPERVLCVRYEEMVQDYYASARSLFDWLDLPMTAEVLSFIHEAKGVDAHAPGVKKNFAAKSQGRWRQQLDKNELELTESLVGEFMDKYGYGD